MNTIEQSRTKIGAGTKIPFWRQLRWNLITFALLLTVIPMLVIGWFFLRQSREQTITQINQQLESVTTLKENEITRWLSTSNQVLDIFLSKATSSNLLVNFSTEGVGGSLSAFVNATLLDGIDSQGSDDPAFKEFFLYDLNGEIIASSDNAQVGKIVRRQPYFEASLGGNHIQSPYYDVGNSELTMVITRPVAGVDGVTVSIIAGRLNLTTLGNIMTERSGLGESGETYLVSLENNYLLTPSRFEGYALNRAYRSQGINDALSGKDGIGIYPGYRNIPVIGVYRWNPELKAAFLAEIDEAEAFEVFNQQALIGAVVVVLTAIGAATLAFYYATRVSQPIVALTGIASQIAAGDLTQRASLQERNEIGLLASTFNSMSDQLQNFVGTLEDRVNARTRDLQIVASVSKSATTILNVDELLQSVVDLTKQSFDLYHAHIYLTDEAGENLVLTAGAGEPGRVMRAQGRQIAINNPNSLVARAGRTRKGVIENDVTHAPDFLPNPLLPNTKSELAVPMVVGDRLIGVLDVQADSANRFTNEDVAVQTSLGDQIAVAVQNARAFSEVQNAEAKVRSNQEELLQAQRIARIGRWTWVPATGEVGWNDMMYEHFGEPHHLAPTFDLFLSHVHPDDASGLVNVMQTAMQSGAETFTHEYRVIPKNGQIRYHAAIGGITRDESGVAVYLVGTAQDITERKGIDAERELVYAAASALTNARTPHDVLAAVLPYSRDKQAYTASMLYIDSDKDNTPEWAITVAEWSINNTPSTPVGSRFYLPEFLFAKLWMANPNEPVFIENVATDANVDEMTRNVMMQIGGHALAIVPLTTQGRWLGILTFSWHEPTQFTEQDRRIYRSMMQQMISTVDALQSAEETQQAREDAEILYSVSTLINEARIEQDIVNAIIQHAIPEAINSVSLNLNEGSDYEKATYVEVVGSWRRDGTSNVGLRIPLAGFNNDSGAQNTMVVINDVKAQLPPEAAAAYATYGVNAIVTIPLFIGGRLTGSLSLSGSEAYLFAERELQMWRAIAEQAATTMERLFLTAQTNRRAAEMETVAQVSAATTSILDMNEMLLSVTDLTKDSFGLYHAHVYLLDDAGEYLVLAAGAGEPGRIMKEQGRSIPINHPNSLVARAASSREGAIANDVTLAPDFLANPLLPNTKSEMAVPMIVGERLVGVLDVQSDITNRFSEDDVRIQTTLAAQIAVAVENARAFTLTELQLRDLEVTSKITEYIRTEPDLETMLENTLSILCDTFQADSAVMSNFNHDTATWHGFVGTGNGITSALAKTFVDPASSYPHGLEAVRTGRVVPVNNSMVYPDFPQVYIEQLGIKSVIVIPVLVGDTVSGVIFLNHISQFHTYTQNELTLAQNLSYQISVGIDRKRAEEQVALFADVVNNTPTGMYIWHLEDPNDARSLRLMGANAASQAATGVSPETIIGKRMSEAFPMLMETAIPKIYTDVALTGNIVNLGEITYSDDNIQEGIFEVKAFPLPNNSMGVSFENITERKHKENEDHILYEVSRELSNARNSADVLDAMSAYLETHNGSSATLFHIEIEEGVPTWLETVATRSNTPESAVAVGSRYYLPEFAFAQIWLSNPNEPALISNMESLRDSDAATYAIFKQLGINATAVIPLYTQNNWIGLISLSWSETVNFNDHDKQILTAIMRQATSKVDALRAGEMTAKRATELQTVAQVSAAATMILDTDALLQSVVDLTKESFGLYHAHVYLMDESGENLVLAAGAGEPGRIMKEQGRSISVTHQNSLVARAARNRDGAIANNVTQAADFLPNPLLPETKSEMAIPLIVGDEVIGVLDVQANTINRFTASDVTIQSTLADQIAVAVQNARAFKITQETAERLREVDRLKSQFLANMSHELRTPLNSIIGYAEVLLDGIDGELGDEAIEDVQAIHGGGKHLLTIINDILDLAKIEAGQMFMDRQEAKLTQVVDEVVATCQILAKNKDISLNVELDGDIPTVFGDSIRLKQIIFNLVNNAIKFTEKGGITVNLGMMNDNNEVVVSIHDTGMGMTQEDIGGLFQQFHQVDGSATRRAGGTGLGLVITRHLVHMHGGEIFVESEKGTGSTFWFTLPVYANQPRQKA